MAARGNLLWRRFCILAGTFGLILSSADQAQAIFPPIRAIPTPIVATPAPPPPVVTTQGDPVTPTPVTKPVTPVTTLGNPVPPPAIPTPSTTPEPATIFASLSGLAMAGVFGLRRRIALAMMRFSSSSKVG